MLTLQALSVLVFFLVAAFEDYVEPFFKIFYLQVYEMMLEQKTSNLKFWKP